MMSLEPLFKKLNSLSDPEVLRQAVPQSGPITTESRLPVLFLTNLWWLKGRCRRTSGSAGADRVKASQISKKAQDC